jgi:F-type H+-transporting ATPase subunit gamma
MANLKEIRIRIASVNSTMQITSAMKMVSAAKLKRAQDAITRMRPYAEKLQEILSNVSGTLDGNEGAYSQQRDIKNVLVVAITSNRGLCGGFNNNVVKEIKANVLKQFGGANMSVLSLGKKAFDYYKKAENHYTAEFGETPFEIFDKLTFDNSSAVADKIMTAFANGKFDKVILVYNKFKNAGTQVVVNEQMLPVVANENQKSTSSVEYIYEPEKTKILEDLIPRSLRVQLFKALLDSNAAEHAARMTAMHKATDNAGADHAVSVARFAAIWIEITPSFIVP